MMIAISFMKSKSERLNFFIWHAYQKLSKHIFWKKRQIRVTMPEFYLRTEFLALSLCLEAICVTPASAVDESLTFSRRCVMKIVWLITSAPASHRLNFS